MSMGGIEERLDRIESLLYYPKAAWMPCCS
jgi:hypothetical protein